METRHAKTLSAVFHRPTSANISFADLEALVRALGGTVSEQAASRVVFGLSGNRREETMKTNTMSSKGYTARIAFDSRDNILVGRVLGIADSVTFHGADADEVALAFHCAIDHYLADCAAEGREPGKPAPSPLTSS